MGRGKPAVHEKLVVARSQANTLMASRDPVQSQSIPQLVHPRLLLGCLHNERQEQLRAAAKMYEGMALVEESMNNTPQAVAFLQLAVQAQELVNLQSAATTTTYLFCDFHSLYLIASGTKCVAK